MYGTFASDDDVHRSRRSGLGYTGVRAAASFRARPHTNSAITWVLGGNDAVNQWKSWIRELARPVKPRAERRIPSGFIAWQTNNPVAKPSTVRDMSSAGLFLLTEERWPIDELIPLTIEVESLLENNAEERIRIQARVARHDEDGIGLSFVLPDGLDPDLWEVLIRNAALLADPKDLSFNLRLLRTALFLYRLCHAEASETLQLFGGELDEARSRSRIAMLIVFGAEELLASEPDADKMRAHPQIVASILKYGSWAQDDLTRQLWTGLLATSCHVNAIDKSSRVFIDLLVNVTPVQGLILVNACKKALELMTETGDLPAARIIFTPEEMIRLTGIYDPIMNGVEISYLFDAGLIEKVFDFSSYIPKEKFDVTPSRLGLELYKRCRADRIEPHAPPDEPESTQPSL